MTQGDQLDLEFKGLLPKLVLEEGNNGRLNPNLVGGQLGALLAAGLECGVCPPAARLLPFLTERALVSCLPGRRLDRPSNCVK